MNPHVRAMIGGFVATIVLSALMLLKGMMGVMPQLDVFSMLGGMSERMMGVAWRIHFLIGTGIGMMAPVMTLILHVIHGAVLGWVFGALGANAPAHG